jgi:hypothetical protein
LARKNAISLASVSRNFFIVVPGRVLRQQREEKGTQMDRPGLV